jgi:hypothetical protein
MARLRKKGAIQNEEVLIEVLYGESFFIPCVDEKDAHSKSVSLNNAKNGRLSPDQQKKIRIQKLYYDNQWGVKVSPTVEIPIYKLVNGEKVLWNREEAKTEHVVEGKLSTENQRILELMIKDNQSTEDILTALADADQKVVLEEIAKRVK